MNVTSSFSRWLLWGTRVWIYMLSCLKGRRGNHVTHSHSSCLHGCYSSLKAVPRFTSPSHPLHWVTSRWCKSWGLRTWVSTLWPRVKSSMLLVFCSAHKVMIFTFNGKGKNIKRIIFHNITINEVLLAHNHAHVFTYCLWLLSHETAELSNCNLDYMAHKA